MIPTESVAPRSHERPGPGLRQTLIVRAPQILLALVALVLIARTERFASPENLGRILTQASIVGVLAVGQAFALIGGGFDLSQGASLALVAASTAWVTKAGYLTPVPAAFAALALGTGLGSINGLFVSAARTNPFVTTLSTLLIFRGATFALLGGLPINNVTEFSPLNEGFHLGTTVVPLRGFLFLGVVAVAWVVLRRTVFGQHVYAVGGNAEAARLAGVRTGRVKAACFALSGLAAGASALLFLSWVRVAKPDTATGYELDAIAACVVGGISLQGGSGSVLGAGAGCLFLQTLGSLITWSGFPDEYRTLVTGAVILTFASADALTRRGERRG